MSLSPAITETLFALGVGDRVVGVTRFCAYPPETSEILKIGGYLDPNWEAIVALRPDLVVMMESQARAEEKALDLGLSPVRVDQHDVRSVLSSFQELGRICSVPERGVDLARRVGNEIEAVRSRVSGRGRPRVLATIGRDAGSGGIRSVWAAGEGTFFGDVIELAGGENVLGESQLGAYPEITREGLIHLDPEVILDIFTDLEERGLTVALARRDWRDLTTLSAVRSGRVHVLANAFLTVPGPRVGDVVDVMAKAVHPEVDW